MPDNLLYKRDTDLVRDNMLINYCLGDDNRLLIESFVRNNGIDVRFDPQRFYFFMTGIHKKFLPPVDAPQFSRDWDGVLAVYDCLLAALRQNGYDGNVFLIKEDNSKQIGLLMSAGESPACAPETMAQTLRTLYMQVYPAESPRRSFASTSFVGPYSGYEQIHQAFLDARSLNDLIFFGVRDRVITEDYRRQTARPCDTTAVMANVRKLLSLLCTGTCAQAVRQAEHIVDNLIAPSYSMQNFITMHAACEDIRAMLHTVYGAALEPQPAERFFFLSQFREALCGAVRAFFAQMEGKRRYSPTILLALSYIRRNYAADVSLAQLSEYAYANPSTLSSEFNAEMGMSLTEYVAALRVRRAQALLAQTDDSVSHIAGACGFASAKYFREQFKKQTGLSPQAYRDGARGGA